MKELTDAVDRRDALLDFQHNLVVIAGAGTGKTSLLVGRLLAALTLHHMELHQVLALTFTENAAAEMHERLHRLLTSFEPWLAGEKIQESDRHVLASLNLGAEFCTRIRELRERGEDLQIATFHGYCLGLLRDNARVLQLPPDLRLPDEDLNRSDFDHAFVEYLRGQREVPSALRMHEPGLLRDFAWNLLGLPADCWTRVGPGARPTGLPAHRQQLQELLQAHEGARQPWRDLAERLLGGYDDLIENRAVRGPEPHSRVPSAGDRELGGKENNARATAALREHLDRLLPHLSADPQGIDSAMKFLTPFLTDYRRQRLARGLVTFDDLLLLTRRCLMENPDFRRKVGGHLRAILVDEFQDTDPLQYDVIFLLAAIGEEERIESPLHTNLRPSVLYVVGDAKQSIYRFRRADVAAFGRAIDQVMTQNGRELHLVSNFRSRPPILEFVHEVCSRSLAENRPFQFQYRKVIPTRPCGGGDPVEIHELPCYGGADVRREREGQQVIAVVESLRNRGHRYGDIAVLLRAATDLNWLLRPLREARVPYLLEGSKQFYKRHEVNLATALISALARPSDPVAVLAVLRSSLVGASDAEIARYLQSTAALDFRTARGKGPVAEGLVWLRELHEEVALLTVDQALTAVLTHRALTITEGSSFEGPQRLANLERLLCRLLAVSPLDLMAAADWLARNTHAGAQDEESPLFDHGMDALRILTVHRAKGLEFDVVIVPDLARQSLNRESRTQAQRLFSAAGEEIVALRLGDCRNIGSAIARTEAGQHQLAEERRLFYVAATRARERLILLSGDGTESRAVWRADLKQISTDPPGVVRAKVDSLPIPSARRRERIDPRPVLAAAAAHIRLVKSLDGDSRLDAVQPSTLGAPREERPVGLPRQHALAVGEAMHRYLAIVDLEDDSVDTSLLEEDLDEDCRKDFQELARRFHGSRLRQRLVAASSVLRELPVAYSEDGGRVVRGTIDALIVENDKITVIDYKTDRVTDHAAAAEAHRDQLLAYGRGVQKALGLTPPPGLAVHFLRDDHTHPLAHG